VVRHSHDSFQLDTDSISSSNAIHEKIESYQPADHRRNWQCVLGHRPCSERSKQPPQVHAALFGLGDSSGDETHSSMIHFYDDAGNVIEKLEHAGDFNEWWVLGSFTDCRNRSSAVH